MLSSAKLILKYDLFSVTLTNDESGQMPTAPRVYKPPLRDRQRHTPTIIEAPSDYFEEYILIYRNNFKINKIILNVNITINVNKLVVMNDNR
jgi:hypothetical protein